MLFYCKFAGLVNYVCWKVLYKISNKTRVTPIIYFPIIRNAYFFKKSLKNIANIFKVNRFGCAKSRFVKVQFFSEHFKIEAMKFMGLGLVPVLVLRIQLGVSVTSVLVFAKNHPAPSPCPWSNKPYDEMIFFIGNDINQSKMLRASEIKPFQVPQTQLSFINVHMTMKYE